MIDSLFAFALGQVGHRPSGVRFAGDADQGAGGGSGEATAADAGEFASESASVAFEESTGGEESASLPGLNDQPEGGDESGGEAEGEAETPEQIAAAAAAAAKPATAKVEKGKGGRKSPEARTSELKAEIDRLTHDKHKTKAEIDQQAARLAALKKETADLEAAAKAGKPAPATAATAATAKTGDAAADAMPEHPEYRDFDTDEEYTEAVGKWRGEMATWNARQIDKVKATVTEGVETRLKRVDDDAATRAAMTTIQTTLDKVRADKADWADKTTNLKGVTSAWYNPEANGENTTPFLTDVAQTLLSQGNTEGGELLYWLGEDTARTQRLADLLPTKQLRDAIVLAPSPKALLEHFATDQGVEEFEALKVMHPVRMMQAVGALTARLSAAPSGSAAAAHTVTKAKPSARPPAGSPGARSASGGSATVPPFEDWMAAEDAKEQAARERMAGIPAAR